MKGRYLLLDLCQLFLGIYPGLRKNVVKYGIQVHAHLNPRIQPPLSSELSMTSAIPNLDSLRRTCHKKESDLKKILKLLYRSNLDVGDGNVEELIHICKPNHSHICHNHRPQISLVTEENTIILVSFLKSLSPQIGSKNYLDRFHTPFMVETIFSRGSNFKLPAQFFTNQPML